MKALRWNLWLCLLLLLAQGYGQLTPAPRFNLLRFFNSQIGASCQSVTETNDGRLMAVVSYTGECYLTKDAMVSLLYLQTPKWASGYYYQGAAFVAGMDSSGYVEWIHHFYSPDAGFRFYNSVTDAQQNLYLLGMLRDTVYIDDSVYTCPEAYNLLMVKIQPDGTIAWTKVIRSLETNATGTNLASQLMMVNNKLVLVNSGGRLVLDGDTLSTPWFNASSGNLPVSIIAQINLAGEYVSHFSFEGGYIQSPLYRSVPVFVDKYVGLTVLFNDTLVFNGDTFVYGPTYPWDNYSAWYMFDSTFTTDTLTVKYVPIIYSNSMNHMKGASLILQPDTMYILNWTDSAEIFGNTIDLRFAGDYIVHFDSMQHIAFTQYFEHARLWSKLLYLPEYDQYVYGHNYDSVLILNGDTFSVPSTDYSSAIIYYDTNFNLLSCKTLGDYRDVLFFMKYFPATNNLWVATSYSYYALLDSVYYDGTYANYGESFLGRIPFHGIVGMDTELKEGMWNLFPNPATDVVWIEGSGKPERIEVMDMQGKYWETTLWGNRLDVSALPAGMYAIRIWGDGKSYFQKLIKENP